MATGAVATQSVKLIANVSEFVAGMDSAAKRSKGLQAQMAQMSATAKAVGSAFSYIKTAATGYIMYRLVGDIRQVSGELVELQKRARQFQIPVDQLFKLGYAAKVNEQELENLYMAFSQMGRRFSDISSAETTRGLEKVGLTWKSIAGKDTLQRFFILADAIKNTTDVTARQAAAVAFFGRSGQQFAAFAALGSKELMKTMRSLLEFADPITESSVEQGKAINDIFDAMSFAAKRTKYAFIDAFGPEIQSLLYLSARGIKHIGEGFDAIAKGSENEGFERLKEQIRTAKDEAMLSKEGGRSAPEKAPLGSSILPYLPSYQVAKGFIAGSRWLLRGLQISQMSEQTEGEKYARGLKKLGNMVKHSIEGFFISYGNVHRGILPTSNPFGKVIDDFKGIKRALQLTSPKPADIVRDAGMNMQFLAMLPQAATPESVTEYYQGLITRINVGNEDVLAIYDDWQKKWTDKSGRSFMVESPDFVQQLSLFGDTEEERKLFEQAAKDISAQFELYKTALKREGIALTKEVMTIGEEYDKTIQHYALMLKKGFITPETADRATVAKDLDLDKKLFDSANEVGKYIADTPWEKYARSVEEFELFARKLSLEDMPVSDAEANLADQKRQMDLWADLFEQQNKLFALVDATPAEKAHMALAERNKTLAELSAAGMEIPQDMVARSNEKLFKQSRDDTWAWIDEQNKFVDEAISDIGTPWEKYQRDVDKMMRKGGLMPDELLGRQLDKRYAEYLDEIGQGWKDAAEAAKEYQKALNPKDLTRKSLGELVRGGEGVYMRGGMGGAGGLPSMAGMPNIGMSNMAGLPIIGGAMQVQMDSPSMGYLQEIAMNTSGLSSLGMGGGINMSMPVMPEMEFPDMSIMETQHRDVDVGLRSQYARRQAGYEAAGIDPYKDIAIREKGFNPDKMMSDFFVESFATAESQRNERTRQTAEFSKRITPTSSFEKVPDFVLPPPEKRAAPSAMLTPSAPAIEQRKTLFTEAFKWLLKGGVNPEGLSGSEYLKDAYTMGGRNPLRSGVASAAVQDQLMYGFEDYVMEAARQNIWKDALKASAKGLTETTLGLTAKEIALIEGSIYIGTAPAIGLLSPQIQEVMETSMPRLDELRSQEGMSRWRNRRNAYGMPKTTGVDWQKEMGMNTAAVDWANSQQAPQAPSALSDPHVIQLLTWIANNTDPRHVDQPGVAV